MKETRNITRSFSVEGRRLGGYAIVFDSPSNDLGGFTEVIDRHALDGVLQRSDVKCFYNHDESRGILARNRRGKGSLVLRADETGLYYEFEAPKTALGDEVLEGVTRGDISGSSFAFTVEKDSWERREDGTCVRTVLRFGKIFDVSPVIDPAYEETSVALRGFKELTLKELRKANKKFNIRMLNRTNEEIESKLQELRAITDEDLWPDAQAEISVLEDELAVRKSCGEDPEDKPDPEDKQDAPDPEDKDKPDDAPDPEDDDDDEKRLDRLKDSHAEFRKEKRTRLEVIDRIEQLETVTGSESVIGLIQKQIGELRSLVESKPKNKYSKRQMFSLIKTINDVVNNRSLSETSAAIVEQGKEEMRKSGLSFSGQIQLPVETREDPVTPAAPAAVVAGTATYGKEAVAEDRLNILAPLYNRTVLKEAGSTFLTGLVGNIAIPKYSGTAVGWKGELDEAEDGKGTFSEVNYSPKRLTAYLDISKQFLAQDSVQAEAMLRADIVNALADKLEATILGNETGTSDKPAGIFNGATAQAVSYSALVSNEQTLEDAKIFGPKTYIVNPAVKTALKTTTVGGTKSDLRMLLENGEANGYKVLCTGNAKGYALADWSELLVCQWGSIDLTVDPYTQAAKGAVRLVINAYFDAGFRRSEAVVAHTLPA